MVVTEAIDKGIFKASVGIDFIIANHYNLIQSPISDVWYYHKGKASLIFMLKSDHLIIFPIVKNELSSGHRKPLRVILDWKGKNRIESIMQLADGLEHYCQKISIWYDDPTMINRIDTIIASLKK